MNDRIKVHQDGKEIYDIVFKSDFSDLKAEIDRLGYEKTVKACIISDSNVAPLYKESLKESLKDSFSLVEDYVIPAGESNKTLDHIADVYEFLIQNHFDRKDVLFALGGGVIGDMTGFTASTYLRGIDFIQIPSSLLAMVDSSVGGKTGVDFRGYKNMVGAFYMPKLVYMNLSVLKTLPQRELSCGIAEVIKYGYIRDKAFLSYLEEYNGEILEDDFLHQIVFTSCAHKRNVVEEDPKEKGVRALLNFGHTIGHAIEKLKKFSLLHGECVAIGMCAAAYLAMKRKTISEEEYHSVCNLMEKYHLPKSTSADGFTADDVLLTMRSDKKTLAGQIRFIMMSKIGETYIDQSLSDEELLEGIKSVLS
jgi:3-dehydroquinate synthase